jgi:MoaA/NifB/PqqE/SkfB family radical SAM enzyme
MTITGINIELTNYCDKQCWICHKTKLGIKNTPLNMDIEVLKGLAKELPHGTIVYFHYYGEPLLYPRLKEAIELFENQITSLVTNGKFLIKKFNEIVSILDSLCISVFENDPDQEEQFRLINEFLEKKKDRKPNTIIKLIGDVDRERYKKFESQALLTYRTLFEKKFLDKNTLPLITDYGICSDFLHKPLVNINGDVSICCAFDTQKLGVIGNLNEHSLGEIWNSEKRKEWLEYHMAGKRHMVPLCKKCNFWGITS